MARLRFSLVALAGLTALAAMTLSLNPQTVVAYGAAGTPQQGAAPVTIVSPLPVPVNDVSGSARTPVQFNFPPNAYEYAVPSNKRLVIEFVSATCSSDVPGRAVEVHITTSVGSQRLGHAFVPVVTASTATTNFQVVSQSTHLYADPGTVVSAGVFAIESQATCGGLAFSGYLMNP